MKKLKERWNIDSNWRLFVIFLVFAVIGSTSTKFAGPVMDGLGMMRENTAGYIYWPLRIVLIFPIYQVLMVIIGWMYGEFEFFWKFEKKMLRLIGLGFLIKNES
jgi:hypothetical protein